MIFKSTIYGIAGTAALFAVYFSVISLISGWLFAVSQFLQFWYFIIGLAIGFGIQIGLYTYLRTAIHHKNASGGVLAISGTTSAAAMISCCAHYLVNILPIVGVTGLVSIISQMQVELFWIGLVFNVFGIVYIGRQIIMLRAPNSVIGFIKRVQLPVIVTVVVLVFISAINLFSDRSDGEAAVYLLQSDKITTLQRQINNEGAVKVSATPKEFSGKYWSFEVALDTHSMDLDNDLMKSAVLTGNNGSEQLPIDWQGNLSGSHHLTGILKFKSLSSRSDSITLKIIEVGGVKERAFVWQFNDR